MTARGAESLKGLPFLPQIREGDGEQQAGAAGRLQGRGGSSKEWGRLLVLSVGRKNLFG